MKIIIPSDKEFNYRECEKLYLTNEKFMGNHCDFMDIVYNSHFYSFYENKELVGCIYVVDENNKLYLNGFSVRKNHLFNIKAVSTVVSFYNCPIFAKTKNRTAEILLKKCGFTLIKTNLNGMKYLKKEITNANKE